MGQCAGNAAEHSNFFRLLLGESHLALPMLRRVISDDLEEVNCWLGDILALGAVTQAPPIRCLELYFKSALLPSIFREPVSLRLYIRQVHCLHV